MPGSRNIKLLTNAISQKFAYNENIKFRWSGYAESGACPVINIGICEQQGQRVGYV